MPSPLSRRFGKNKVTLSAAQCRAARGAPGLTPADLARETGLSVVSLGAFERGGGIRYSNAQMIVAAFENAGIEFIPGNGGGPGVRLKGSH